MKNIILLIALALLVSVSASAQPNIGKGKSKAAKELQMPPASPVKASDAVAPKVPVKATSVAVEPKKKKKK